MDTGKPSLVSAGDSISRTETSSTGTNEAIPIATGSIDSQTTAARSGSISILDSPQLTSINTEKKSFQKDFTVFHKSSFQESLVEELPNSFFEVTVQDVQLMQHLLQRTAEATANPPLQTQSMKQISVNTEHRRYERVWHTLYSLCPPCMCTYVCGCFCDLCRQSYESSSRTVGFYKEYLQQMKHVICSCIVPLF